MSAGRRPADIQNPVSEVRWREISFLQFYQKICKKWKIWSDKVLTHGISFFKAQQIRISAVSRNEKQIFVAVIWRCRPADIDRLWRKSLSRGLRILKLCTILFPKKGNTITYNFVKPDFEIFPYLSIKTEKIDFMKSRITQCRPVSKFFR